MDEQTLQRILALYGVSGAQIMAAQKGYRNTTYPVVLSDGTQLNLIVYKREPAILAKILNANRVADFLAARNFPARSTANPRIVRLRGEHTRRYACLYHYLPGTTIPWEAYTMEHIKQLGAMMSDMHAMLHDVPRGDVPFVVDECRALLKRMEKYFAEDGVHDAMAAKLGLAILDTTRLQPALTACVDLPGQHALHMDFVRGNILFAGEGEALHISGVLDFEKTAWGPPIFDIARTLAFLIIDCKYKPEGKVRKYFIHSGYNKRGVSSFDQLLQPESWVKRSAAGAAQVAPRETHNFPAAVAGQSCKLLEDLIDFFLLYDFYKFLRHNPYESLINNEHFVRTRDFLLKRNILAKTEMLQ